MYVASIGGVRARPRHATQQSINHARRSARRTRIVANNSRQRLAHTGGDVEQRRQRPRRGQRIARADEHRRVLLARAKHSRLRQVRPCRLACRAVLASGLPAGGRELRQRSARIARSRNKTWGSSSSTRSTRTMPERQRTSGHVAGPGRNLHSAHEAELVQHVADMRLDRLASDDQLFCNLTIAKSLGNEKRDLTFAIG